MNLKNFLISSALFAGCIFCNAQKEYIPFVGAEVFIEPGQKAEEIDTWFKVMNDRNFTVCRIRMFESYMKKSDGKWDFSLFDNAFRSAERYGIKVYANPVNH